MIIKTCSISSAIGGESSANANISITYIISNNPNLVYILHDQNYALYPKITSRIIFSHKYHTISPPIALEILQVSIIIVLFITHIACLGIYIILQQRKIHIYKKPQTIQFVKEPFLFITENASI